MKDVFNKFATFWRSLEEMEMLGLFIVVAFIKGE
jgi:hypothetical protein